MQELLDVRSCTVYQKAEAKRLITEEEISGHFCGAGLLYWREKSSAV